MTGEYSPAVVADLSSMATAAAPLWGLSPKTTATLMSLSENATFRLDDPDSGRRLSLRLHRQGYHRTEEIRSELMWINALRQKKIIDTPAALPGRDGDILHVLPSPAGLAPRRAVAFDFVPGDMPTPDDHDLSHWFSTLGALTARLHDHTQSWPLPNGFVRKRWDVSAMIGEVSYWGPWQASLGLSAEGRRIFQRATDRIHTTMAAYGTASDRFGLIHADLRLSNLLVDGDALRVIDFDDSGLSWFLYDFAAAISFHEQHPDVHLWEAAWLDSYQQLRRLSPQDLAVLPALKMARRLLLTAWLASHSEIPLAQELGSDYTSGTAELAEAFLSA
ncbi:phosphotransferase enzyme family protein [Insolitispirillum peregrinum]|uniref:Ser/Thr protein kinase RdoA involved in Cpx stress response, MazF antagonist n=1 Tax=Insolitispirillum peregrinum TaxID=80876 RepID=A0A1N7IPL3_9PROT|nr:phosphotransferase [Insolitispirillum peregrinum]SIS38921.1 Ser/Thr protein kinase RdoA involved in Cpx stress response, MazF antagonist [Insolitispirillum peregrinum]